MKSSLTLLSIVILESRQWRIQSTSIHSLGLSTFSSSSDSQKSQGNPFPLVYKILPPSILDHFVAYIGIFSHFNSLGLSLDSLSLLNSASSLLHTSTTRIPQLDTTHDDKLSPPTRISALLSKRSLGQNQQCSDGAIGQIENSWRTAGPGFVEHRIATPTPIIFHLDSPTWLMVRLTEHICEYVLPRQRSATIWPCSASSIQCAECERPPETIELR